MYSCIGLLILIGIDTTDVETDKAYMYKMN